MRKLEIVLILVNCMLVLATNRTNEAQSRIATVLRPPPETSQPQDEPSFFSKITSWLFPFGNAIEKPPDTLPAETHQQYAPQYLPPPMLPSPPRPPPHHGYVQEPCNPCNKEPWIPVAGSYGANTVIGFVQQPPPYYGAPQQQFNIPRDQHGLSSNMQPVHEHYNRPSQHYVPPSSIANHEFSFKYHTPPPHKTNAFNTQKPVLPKQRYQFPRNGFKLSSSKYKFTPAYHQQPPIPLHFDRPQMYSTVKPYSSVPLKNYNSPPEDELLQPPQFDVNYVPSAIYPFVSGGALDHNVPSASGNHYVNINKPIPFPGLSLYPLPPLHNSQPFHGNFGSFITDNIPQDGSKVEIQTINNNRPQNVQVLPSVRIADYLASIEHPVNIIQSPLVEVIAVNNEEYNSSVAENGNHINVTGSLTNNFDDVHVSATSQNVSYQNPPQDQVLDSEFEQGKDAGLNSPHNIHHDFSSGFTEDHSDQQSLKNNEFNHPPLDYSNWTPNFGELLTSMVPPPVEEESTWLAAAPTSSFVSSTTAKPKQIQIVIPYISSNSSLRDSKEQYFDTLDSSSGDSTPSLFTMPPTTNEPVWPLYLKGYKPQETNKLTTIIVPVNKTKSISNIRDLLQNEKQTSDNLKDLPFDIITLQKNIDDWTQQEFSSSITHSQKAITSPKLVPSKNIPSEYLTTQPYNKILSELTTIPTFPDHNFDHEPASSDTETIRINSNADIESNFVLTETTPPTTYTSPTLTVPLNTSRVSKHEPVITTDSSIITPLTKAPAVTSSTATHFVTPQSMWDRLQLGFSSFTKEKVYIVTPQPWKVTAKEVNDKLSTFTEPPSVDTTKPKLSVVIQSSANQNIKEILKNMKNGPNIVFSEWPHLINNLITTTTTEASQKPALLGLMALSHTLPPNETVETYAGHSKVITMVTPTSAIKKKNHGKKAATTNV